MGIAFVLAFFLIIILLLIVRYIIGSADDIEMFDIQDNEYTEKELKSLKDMDLDIDEKRLSR